MFAQSQAVKKVSYRIMFWNVENLFDTFNDSLTNDDEFTPAGIRRWTYSRYQQKITNIFKVLSAAGDPYPPEIIALCEVENKRVLKDITFSSPFLRYGYEIIHQDSGDPRGIDVAVLYNPQEVRVLNKEFITPGPEVLGKRGTRDIVYVEALIRSKDTINLFFTHWPSKYGGAGITEPHRKQIAGLLRFSIDTLQENRADAKIIIGGDFNDPPDAESINEVLGAVCAGNGPVGSSRLYNVSCGASQGTNKYRGIWQVIDQFMVTGNILGTPVSNGFSGVVFEIFDREFLLERDEVYPGLKPNRTWEGMRYKGGFSDHLPVILHVY